MQPVRMTTKNKPLIARLTKLLTMNGFYDFFGLIFMIAAYHNLYGSECVIRRIFLIQYNRFYTIIAQYTFY